MGNGTNTTVTQDLIIDVQPYHGWPTIFINFDSLPASANLEDSAYKFYDWKGEELITITPEMVAEQNPTTKDLYITAGYSTSTFSILTYFANSSDLTLTDGYSRVGTLKLN